MVGVIHLEAISWNSRLSELPSNCSAGSLGPERSSCYVGYRPIRCSESRKGWEGFIAWLERKARSPFRRAGIRPFGDWRAYLGPTFRHHRRIDSWVTEIPRSGRSSSTPGRFRENR